MDSQKAQLNVTPAQAGVQKSLKALDSGLRWNDGSRQIQTFCETIIFLSRYQHCATRVNFWCHFERSEKSLSVARLEISPVGRNDRRCGHLLLGIAAFSPTNYARTSLPAA